MPEAPRAELIRGLAVFGEPPGRAHAAIAAALESPVGCAPLSECLRPSSTVALLTGDRFLEYEPETGSIKELPRQPAQRFRDMAANLTSAAPGETVADLARHVGITAPRFDHPLRNDDPHACILCGLCVRTCREGVWQNVLGFDAGKARAAIASKADKEIAALKREAARMGDALEKAGAEAYRPKHWAQR